MAVCLTLLIICTVVTRALVQLALKVHIILWAPIFALLPKVSAWHGGQPAGHLVEALMSKVGAVMGREGDATPFTEVTVDNISNTLHS